MTTPFDSPPGAGRDPAPAVTRSLRILTLLADSGGAPVTLSEIARALNIAKSSTANLCTVLEDGGMIQRGGLGYTLGRRTMELGGAYVAGFDQVREFYGWAADSPLLGHEVVQIAMLDATDVLYLARHEGRAPLRLTASIGSRFPAAPTAVGNALLAALEDDEIRRRFTRPEHFPRRTQNSVADVETLLAKIHRVRERGWALDDEEVHPGVTGVAVLLPPWARGDQPLALGTSLMTEQATPEVIDRAVAELRDGVAHLTNGLLPASTVQSVEQRSAEW